LLIKLFDPVLDIGLGVLGDNLARLDDLAEELFEVAFGPVGFLLVERPGGLDDGIKKGRRFLGFRASRGLLSLFSSTHWKSPKRILDCRFSILDLRIQNDSRAQFCNLQSKIINYSCS